MRIYLRDHGLKAYIELTCKDLRHRFSKDQIRQILEKSNIRYGLLLDDWEDTLETCMKDPLKNYHLLIARGKEPVAGRDGYVEYLVNPKKPFPPPRTDDPEALAAALTTMVHRGQPLARLHPPTHGEPGRKVTGEAIPAPEGKPAELKIGRHVELSPQDRSVVVASMDGHLRISPSGALMVDRLEVHASIRTDIYSKHSVLIQGDVKSGVTIRAAGDVIVLGAVEDAEIITAGDIYIVNGFMGRGRGILRAGQNVYVKHVDHQRIFAGRDVFIEDEMLQSKCMAGRKLYQVNSSGSIVGGHIMVAETLEAGNLGNRLHIRTEIEIANGSDLARKINQTEKQLAFVKQKLEHAKHCLTKFFEKKVKDCANLQREKAGIMALKAYYETQKKVYHRLQEKLECYKKKLEQQKQNARLEVKGYTHPGVIVRFRGNVYQTPFPRRGLVLTSDYFFS